jgi:hypothetical protein
MYLYDMIIYNVTTKIESAIKDEWLTWLKEEHIRDILNTGCFINANILQLLETDDSEGPTFAIQYHAESKALYNRYIEMFAGIMRQKAIDKWGGRFISFRSVMQVVN